MSTDTSDDAMGVMAVAPLSSRCAAVFERAENVCFGVSPFNSHFSRELIRRLADWGWPGSRGWTFSCGTRRARSSWRRWGTRRRRPRGRRGGRASRPTTRSSRPSAHSV
ncbi:tRNA-dependent cyclodipeptide synthase [Streptomyces sp. NPDC006385]|uniref:tRNA-dependent cyclodipeptide synthase n=1 Tax=Streptomyces sp. NPDC006385 TaxID=3156761 RepID=UPI0033ABD579